MFLKVGRHHVRIIAELKYFKVMVYSINQEMHL